jgi:hypothetical protein
MRRIVYNVRTGIFSGLKDSAQTHSMFIARQINSNDFLPDHILKNYQLEMKSCL